MAPSILRSLALGSLALASLPVFSAAPVGLNSSSALGTRSNVPGYRSVGYFTGWHIYAPTSYTAPQLPANDLTHVLFSFAQIRPDGTVFLADKWADIDINKNWNEAGNNVYGCVKDLYQLKKQNRNMKVLLSIGGYTSSQNPNFGTLAGSPAGRRQFSATSVALLKDLGLDGIDIDWEYPQNDAEATNYVLLLGELRAALDRYSAEHASGHHFEITIASPAGPKQYNTMHMAEMDKFLDAWHIMTYDYAGAWSNNAGHSANLYPSSDNPTSTDYSTERAITDYLNAGIPAHKIVFGLAMYGHAFQGTDGIGKPFNGVGEKENGNWEYRHLPKPGVPVYHDTAVGSAYSYDPATHELISFDTPQEVQRKAAYIKEKGLGGAMYWEMSQDKEGPESLVGTMMDSLGRGNLEQSQNWLEYPQSQYDNIKAGMRGQ